MTPAHVNAAEGEGEPRVEGEGPIDEYASPALPHLPYKVGKPIKTPVHIRDVLGLTLDRSNDISTLL